MTSRARSVLVSVCLVAASVRLAHAAGSKAVDPAIVEFLLTSAAQDFHDHGPNLLRVRKVRVGHVLNPAGEAQYRLCGQFIPGSKDAGGTWVDFATVKTSGYEQWIGDSNYCKGPIVWDKEGDLSSSLQKRLDALRHP